MTNTNNALKNKKRRERKTGTNTFCKNNAISSSIPKTKEITGQTRALLKRGREDYDDEEEEERDDGKLKGIERVEKTGVYGSYGNTKGAMSIEDDEWATSFRAWVALSKHLTKEHLEHRKVWMPFYYDGKAGERLKKAFAPRCATMRVIHKKQDFFKVMNDTKFLKSSNLVVVDNPPYTGKGMKERVLKCLIENDVSFCLLLPLGVLHSQFLRTLLLENDNDYSKEKKKNIQVIIPRRVLVHKENGEEIPFKYLCWLCYGIGLERDLILMDED